MKKINKTAARKLYEQKIPFIVVPCNMRPDSVFAMKIRHFFKTFNNFYNEYCYYNCNNENGRYPSFYIED